MSSRKIIESLEIYNIQNTYKLVQKEIILTRKLCQLEIETNTFKGLQKQLKEKKGLCRCPIVIILEHQICKTIVCILDNLRHTKLSFLLFNSTTY